MYQSMLMGADMVKLFLFRFIRYIWLVVRFHHTGPHLVHEQLLPMWFSAHFAVLLATMGHVCVALLTVAMTADRLFALSKPHQYAKTQHPKFYWSAFVISISLGYRD